MMKRALWLSTLAVLVAGCAAGMSGEAVGSSGQWLCEAGSDTVTCSAAIPARTDEPGAYACTGGASGRVACPPTTTSEDLADLLGELGVDGVFDDLPWACLLTGEHQRHCMKDLGEARSALRSTDPGDPEGGEFTGGPGPDSGGEPGDAPGTAPPPAGDEFRPATPPSDCLPGSWETYFCEHATFSYRSHGVDISFPCDIFDAGGGFVLPSGFGGGGDGPSCHDGEWAMRNGAWMDAVSAGCLGLSDAILVMCQQAANYAPESGACGATGTW